MAGAASGGKAYEGLQLDSARATAAEQAAWAALEKTLGAARTAVDEHFEQEAAAMERRRVSHSRPEWEGEGRHCCRLLVASVW